MNADAGRDQAPYALAANLGNFRWRRRERRVSPRGLSAVAAESIPALHPNGFDPSDRPPSVSVAEEFMKWEIASGDAVRRVPSLGFRCRTPAMGT